MNAQVLQTVGEMLYGKQWQTDLARDLDVSPRTVRHWVNTGAIPPTKWNLIREAAATRASVIQRATELIERQIASLT